MLAFASAGNLAYRLGGQGFNTGPAIGTVRDGEWHHLAATKSGAAAALYVDGEPCTRSPTGAGSQLALGPWHVMRNGANQCSRRARPTNSPCTRVRWCGRDPAPL